LLAVLNVELAHMLSSIRQKPDFHLINVFGVVIVVQKCITASPGSLLLFCAA